MENFNKKMKKSLINSNKVVFISNFKVVYKMNPTKNIPGISKTTTLKRFENEGDIFLNII
jgi:hypothetical protein